MKYPNQLYRSMSKMVVASALLGAGFAHAEASFIAPRLTEPAAAPDVTSLSDPDSNLGDTTAVTEITPEMRTQVLGEAQRALHRLNADIQKQLEQRDDIDADTREAIARADREGRDSLMRELNILRLRDADLNPTQYFLGGVIATYDVVPRLKINEKLSGDVGGKIGFAMYFTANKGWASGIRVTPIASLKGGVVLNPAKSEYPAAINSRDLTIKFWKGLSFSFIYFQRNADGFPVGNLQDAAGLYVGAGAELARTKYPKFLQSFAEKKLSSTRFGATVYVKTPVTFMNRIGELSSAAFGLPGVFMVELQSGTGLDKPVSFNADAQYVMFPGSNNGDGMFGADWM